MSTEELLAQVLGLPRTERARVVEEVLASLEEPEEDVARAWASELQRRSRALADGTAARIPWETARAQILAEARTAPPWLTSTRRRSPSCGTPPYDEQRPGLGDELVAKVAATHASPGGGARSGIRAGPASPLIRQQPLHALPRSAESRTTASICSIHARSRLRCPSPGAASDAASAGKGGGGGGKGGGAGKGGGGRPPNGPSTTGSPSGPGRGNNPPSK